MATINFTASKSVPPPFFQRGAVYCVSSLSGKAQQWYREEAKPLMSTIRRQGISSREGLRRQPSRKAKYKPPEVGMYVLSKAEARCLLIDPTGPAQAEQKRKRTHLPSPDPSDNGTYHKTIHCEQILEASVASFLVRLTQAIQEKAQLLRDRQGGDEAQPQICSLAERRWDCLNEEYCGHGLALKSLKWVPKQLDKFRPRIRAEMEGLFSCNLGNNQPEVLMSLKRNRGSKLKAITLKKVALCEPERDDNPEMMKEAQMLASPTLGRWPQHGFAKENMNEQIVEFGGLIFAVDVCLDEPGILML